MDSGNENGCMSSTQRALPFEEAIPLAELTSIKFNFMTSSDIGKNSSVEIVDAMDLNNPKLGLPNPLSFCETCGARADSYNQYCHSGMIRLPSVIYHPYFLPEAIKILNKFCPGCKCIGHNIHKKGSPKQFKKLETRTNRSGCKYCHNHGSSGKRYPKVKFKLISDKQRGSSLICAEVQVLKEFRHKEPGEFLAKDFWNFIPENRSKSESCDMIKMVLSPFQIFSLLKEVPHEFIQRYIPRRELLFLLCIPVTSNSHRITEMTLPHLNVPQLVLESRTMAYNNLLKFKKKVDAQLHHQPWIPNLLASQAFACLNSSKLQANSSKGEMSKPSETGCRWIRNVVFGKRSDHTFNMVTVGDPKIRLGEIGIPCNISGRLLVAERLTFFNNEKLKRGCKLQLKKKSIFTKNSIDSKLINTPKISDMIYRPLEDGDTVLIYRPPSVHQHSHIALKVKILSSNHVISINPLCCAPLKGDFDGDVLYGYIPQSVTCRVELSQLVRLDHQLLNAQDGSSLLSLSHDSLTAAYLLTGTDVFLDKFEMQQLQMLCPRKLNLPALLKSLSSQVSPLWTGKQLFSSLLPENLKFSIEPEVDIRQGDVLVSTESFWLKNSIMACIQHCPNTMEIKLLISFFLHKKFFVSGLLLEVSVFH